MPQRRPGRGEGGTELVVVESLPVLRDAVLAAVAGGGDGGVCPGLGVFLGGVGGACCRVEIN